MGYSAAVSPETADETFSDNFQSGSNELAAVTLPASGGSDRASGAQHHRVKPITVNRTGRLNMPVSLSCRVFVGCGSP